MENLRIAFFGTPTYSLLVADALVNAGFTISAVITKPPMPVGRKHIKTPSAAALWATNKDIPVITPQSDQNKPWLFSDEAEMTRLVLSHKPDILISADYTQKIPLMLVKNIRLGGLNVHPSLLPAYRGPAPIPWAIHNGEEFTGVSIATLGEDFDAGKIVAQEKEPIKDTDTTELLLDRLFKKGAELLVEVLPIYSSSFPNVPTIKPHTSESYHSRLTRDHGFEPWAKIKKAIETGEDAKRINRKYRAFHPWPGLWTIVLLKGGEKRMKLLSVNMQRELLHLSEVQLEGKTPQPFSLEFKRKLGIMG